MKALDDSYSMLQSVAIYSLGQIGDQATAAVPKLIEFLLKPDFTDIVQVNNMAALALGEIGDKTAIEPLVKALNDAAYHERKFTIAYSLALLEGSDGVGYTELKRMKDNYELIDHELESFEQLQERIKKGQVS
ncbi:MAG: HEAT repeat domain-containing protein, partial [Candidatus Heimdallarchaeota archaeon]